MAQKIDVFIILYNNWEFIRNFVIIVIICMVLQIT